MTKAREIASAPETVLLSGTFTSAAQVDMTNSLSDTYKFYKLYLTFVSSAVGSTITDLLLRFRENTTNKTSNYYGGGSWGSYTGASGSYYSVNNGSAGYISIATSSARGFSVTNIFRNDATTGVMNTQGYDNVNDGGYNYSYINDTMTNFNGISLVPTNGTISGYYILTGINA